MRQPLITQNIEKRLAKLGFPIRLRNACKRHVCEVSMQAAASHFVLHSGAVNPGWGGGAEDPTNTLKLQRLQAPHLPAPLNSRHRQTNRQTDRHTHTHIHTLIFHGSARQAVETLKLRSQAILQAGRNEERTGVAGLADAQKLLQNLNRNRTQ